VSDIKKILWRGGFWNIDKYNNQFKNWKNQPVLRIISFVAITSSTRPPCFRLRQNWIFNYEL